MDGGCCLPCRVTGKLQCRAALPRDAVASQLHLGMHDLPSFFCWHSGEVWAAGNVTSSTSSLFCLPGESGMWGTVLSTSPDTAWRALASPVRLSPSFSQPDWVIATFPNAGDALRMPVIFCLQGIATELCGEHNWRMSALDALMHPENKLVPNSAKWELQLQALFVFLALSGSSSGCCLQDPSNTPPGFLSPVGGKKVKWLFSQQSLD